MPALSRARLQELLDESARETGVPGASVAVLYQDALTEAATGVINLRTGVEVTTDTIFQIGSISKIWTAVLVLQLVDEGIIDIDDPVRQHLPEFRIADAGAAERITIRHLLTHGGGFDGDYFADTGRGADAIEKFVSLLHTAPQFFEPGDMFAYNNAGWVVLGRLVEVIRGQDYLTVVKERLYAPLGLEHAVTLPEEALLQRTVVGHVRGEKGDWVPTSVWSLPHSTAPTGAALTMSAANLARFAGMLINDGTAQDGTRILSAASARRLREHQASLPVPGFVGDRFGHGAFLFDYKGGTAFGHDGQTIGQTAYLRVLPDHDLAIVVMTNRESPIVLFETFVGHVLETLTPVRLTPVPEAPETPIPADADLIVGSYANNSLTAEVTVDDSGQAFIQLGSPNLPMGAQPQLAIAAMDRHTYLSQVKGDAPAIPFHFIDQDGCGKAEFLNFVRMLKRV